MNQTIRQGRVIFATALAAISLAIVMAMTWGYAASAGTGSQHPSAPVPVHVTAAYQSPSNQYLREHPGMIMTINPRGIKLPALLHSLNGNLGCPCSLQADNGGNAKFNATAGVFRYAGASTYTVFNAQCYQDPGGDTCSGIGLQDTATNNCMNYVGGVGVAEGPCGLQRSIYTPVYASACQVPYNYWWQNNLEYNEGHNSVLTNDGTEGDALYLSAVPANCTYQTPNILWALIQR